VFLVDPILITILCEWIIEIWQHFVILYPYLECKWNFTGYSRPQR